MKNALHGVGNFPVHRIIGNDTEAASDVSVTDGVQQARAISFFSVTDGLIVKMVELARAIFHGRQPYAPRRANVRYGLACRLISIRFSLSSRLGTLNLIGNCPWED